MSFQKIVVATDFSEASLGALETAFDLALKGGRTLYLVHVMDPYVIAGTRRRCSTLQSKNRLKRPDSGWKN